jgi:pimeloyl-ACP methyl ester carboxylesterase
MRNFPVHASFMKVYFISGMGADWRIYKYIQLPKGFEMEHLHWIPAEKGETLSAYALRLASRIDTREPFVLVGTSMGGMMSVEIAKRFPPAALVLISSIPVSSQMPGYLKLAKALRLTSMVPVPMLKKAATFKYFFSREATNDKAMIRQLILESDNAFIQWAMGACLDWRNEEIPPFLSHIHGSRDEVFPIWLTRPTHKIRRAGHMMVMSHGRQVNAIIGEILEKATAGCLPA